MEQMDQNGMEYGMELTEEDEGTVEWNGINGQGRKESVIWPADWGVGLGDVYPNAPEDYGAFPRSLWRCRI